MKGRLAVLLALSLLPLALSLPCFFGLTWAAGDLIRQFGPWKELGRQALAAGHLPLWNPTVFCGMPLAGNFQSGLFYPLHFYFYFLPFSTGLGIHLGIHVFLSGLGFYVWPAASNVRALPPCWRLWPGPATPSSWPGSNSCPR